MPLFPYLSLGGCKPMLLALLCLCAGISPLNAQKKPTFDQVAKALNAQIKAKKEGAYTLEHTFKSMLGSDTTRYAGRVLYSRKGVPTDSIGRFVCYFDGKLSGFYDGQGLYMVGHNPKRVVFHAAQDGISGAIKGRFALEDMLFPPFVANRKKPILRSPGGERRVEDAQIAGNACFLLERIDSLPLSPAEKIYPDDPDMGAVVWRFYVQKSNYALLKMEQWMYLNETPQYLSYTFSEISPIPGGFPADMQDTLAQLLKDGHQLQQYEPESDEAPTPEDSVAATDSVLLPLCHLLTLGGDTVTLDDAKGPLVLLDFWYRACLPCAKSAPEISKLHEDFAHKGLSVYAINPQDKNIAALRQYTQAKNIKYDIYLSSEDRCPLLNEVNGYPTFILYRAADKKILYRQIGYNEEMYATMKAIIAGNL